MHKEDSIKGKDDGVIIKGRYDGNGGHYKRDGKCRKMT